MGYVQKRVGRDGKPRYTAVYHDLRGERRSAGTFPNKKDADKAWQKAEMRVGEGRLNDPRRRGRQSFRRYVTEEWLPNHVMEVTTREAYTYQISKHILPWFGPMRMNEIMASHVREWVTDLQGKGVSAASIQKVRFILSAIFSAALDDVTFLHPCKGVKTPTGDRRQPPPVSSKIDTRTPRLAASCSVPSKAYQNRRCARHPVSSRSDPARQASPGQAGDRAGHKHGHSSEGPADRSRSLRARQPTQNRRPAAVSGLTLIQIRGPMRASGIY